MRLTANVRRVTGKTKYYHSTLSEEGVAGRREIPVPARLEIREGDGGFFVLHLDAEGGCLADDWSPTLDEAKRQAKYAFAIGEDDWSECD